MNVKIGFLKLKSNKLNEFYYKPSFIYYFLILCTFLAILYNGYGFGEGDQIFYLPFIYHWNNPNIFPNDLLLNQSYARESITWTIIAFLSRFMDIRLLFLILYFTLRYLSLLLTYKIAYVWYKKANFAWLAVLFGIIVYPVIGSGYSSFDDNFCTRILVDVLGLSALYYFIRDMPYLSSIMIFAGGLFHIISIIPFFTGLLFASFINKKWKTVLALMFSFFFSGFITYVFALHHGLHHKMFTFYSDDWYKILKSNVPSLFPHTWSLSTWSQIILFVMAYYIIYLVKKYRNIYSEMDKLSLIINCSMIMLFVVSLFGSYFHFALLIQLCLMRGYLLFMFLLTMSVIGLAFLENNKWYLVLVGIFLISCWITGNSIFQFFGIMSSILIMVFHKNINSPKSIFNIFIFGSIILSIIIFLYVLFSMYNRTLLINIPLIIVFITGFLTLSLLFYRKIRAPNNIFLVLLLILPPLFLPSHFLLPKWLRNKGFMGERTLYKPYEEMEKQVREIIPLDATVIIPPNWMKFRINTLRSPFVTYIDGVTSEFNQEFALEWLRRIKIVNNIYNDNDGCGLEEEVINLRNMYKNINLNYIITSKQMNFPLISSVYKISLYKIDEDWYEEHSNPQNIK